MKNMLRSLWPCARPAVPLLAVILAIAPDNGEAQSLTLDFSSPATNASYGAQFTGDFTYDPNNSDLSVQKISGGSIAGSPQLSYSSGSGSVTLSQEFGQSGTVGVRLTRTSGSPSPSTNTVDFSVVFLAPSSAMTLTPNFTSPATNSSPGATYTNSFSFTPTNSPARFSLVINSGGTIVPATNVTLTTNLVTGRVNFSMKPLTNTSGTVSATMIASNGFTVATSSFQVVFRSYAPVIADITAKTMPEDGTTNIAFVVTDSDTAPASLVLAASSSNTNLIDAAGLTLGGSGTNRTITLTPKANINGSATITLTASDGDNTDTNTFSLTVTPVADRPVIAGLTNVQATSTGGAFNVLPTIDISDVDHNMPSAATQTVTVTLSPSTLARFPGNATTYTTSGVPAAVTTALRNLQATPQLAGGVPGSASTLTLAISVNDGTFNVSTNGSATITTVNSAPALQVSISPTNIVEGQSLKPFILNFLTDPDLGDSVFTLVISVTNAYEASLGTITPTNRLENMTATQIDSELRQLFYNSIPGTMTSSIATVNFDFEAFDSNGESSVFTASLQITQVQSPPSISGIPVETRIINNTPAGTTMFPAAFVSDPDENGNQLVQASLSASPALGTFTTNNTPLLTQSSLISLLRSAKFIPDPGAVPVGAESNVVIRLTVTDATGNSVQNENLTIRIQGVNNAPQFPGFPELSQQPVLIPPAATLYPFKDIKLTSDDTNNIAFSLTIDSASKGTLSNLGSFVKSGVTTYLMSGSVTSILSSLTNITYQLNPAFTFPPSDPGGTTFTLSAQDYALLTKTVSLYIQVQAEPRHHLVTRALNDGLPGSFTYALSRAGNNDFITFALPSYPAVIRMPGTVSTNLTRNLTIKGPGANLLTISGDNNGDNAPDRQIFQISAAVTIEGVTLSRGTANYGGAVQVLNNGVLTLRNASVVDSVAAYYGGGIDVTDGSLILDRVFVGRNLVGADTGAGGGGISAYTTKNLTIRNSTFSGNRQANGSGSGGGAMIVENSGPGAPMYVTIEHSTFAENTDAAGMASAILAVNEDAIVRPAYTIFSDKSGRNLDVAGNGAFDSTGANLSDDSTQTSFNQGGQPGSVILLDHVTDAPSTDALLSPLALSGDPTPYYELLGGSPAIDYAIGSANLVDQRGVLRTGVPDSGAFEFGASGRLVINEIYAGTGAVHYVELYVRRDSTPVNLANYSLFAGETEIHSFRTNISVGTNNLFAAGATNSAIIRPGYGMVIALTTNPVSMTANGNPNPVIMPSLLPTTRLADNSVISVGLSSGATFARQSYLTRYLDPVTGTNLLSVGGESIALAPQFRGHALIPHSYVKSGPFEGGDTTVALGTDAGSPAADADDVPFGLANAFPVALSDIFVVTEDELASLNVLGNDFDSDGNDRVVVVDVSTGSGAGSGDAATAASTQGAMVTVDPTNSPLRGGAILFDPRAAAALQRLPVTTESIDTFFYEGIDIGRAEILSQSLGSNSTVVFESTNHRLTNGQQIIISGSSQSGYNGTFNITVTGEDHFAVSNSFFSGVATLGAWQTALPRAPTARTEASVTVRVLGVNDAPVAGPDVVAGITERTAGRVMIRPDLMGATNSYPTDPSIVPVMLSINLIRNDDDVDTDDDWSTLRIFGVMDSVHAISGYSGIAGASPVTVSSAAHGLTSGDQILIANYGGSPAYNGYMFVTVVDANTFTIPRTFVDDNADKGVWVRAAEAQATTITNSIGAGLSLILRADVAEDHIVYNASVSSWLQGLSQNELYTNRVYYALRDRHGATAIGQVDFIISGVNNAPVAQPDPGSVSGLNPLVTSSNTVPDILGSGLDFMYTLPPASGASNRLDVHALDRSSNVVGTIVLDDLFFTDEDTPVTIDAAQLVLNDSDIDRTNVLSVISVDAVSREGVALTFAGGFIGYDPVPVVSLQAMMRGEITVDSFNVVVSDGATGGLVTSLVAVAVTGVNDKPVASDVLLTTHEDENLRFDPRTNAFERDINGVMPDDRLTLVSSTNVANPGLAPVTIGPTGVLHEATMSDLMNELVAGEVFTNTFSYTVRDDSFLLAADDHFDVEFDRGPYTLPVLVNDRDYIGSTGTFTIVSVGPTANEGSATMNSNGTAIIYTPPFSLYAGPDHFRYIIRNAEGVESRARVTVRMINPPVNGILRAANDAFAVASGEVITMNVLANDGNTPGASGLAITRLVSTSLPGQPVLTNNTFVYDASSGPSQLTFTYEISAGGGSRAQADVVLNVYDLSGALQIQDDTFHVLSGSLSNQLPVLLNDGLLGESNANYRIRSIVGTASRGVLTTNAAGTSLVYTPNVGFIGTEQVSYIATDGLGGTGSGTVHIVVGQVEVARDFYTVALSSTQSLDVLENDRMLPLPRGTLQIVSVSPGSSSHGTISVGAGGSNLLFTANATAAEVTYSYVVQDLSTPGRLATGVVTVATVADGAYANPDRYVMRGNGANYELNVLANDISYPSAGKVYSVVSVVSAPNNGGAAIIQDGQIIYTPAEGFFGEESFTYRMSDSVTTDDAIVTVSVRSGDLSVARDRFAVYYEHQAGTNIARSFSLPVLDNDRILPPLDQALSVVSIGVGSNAPSLGGSAALGGSQAVTYRPLNPPSPAYVETFAYEVNDGAGRQASATVEVRVMNRASNLVAVTHGDAYAVARNSSNNVLNVLFNDGIRPASAASWTITSVSASSAGATISIQSGAIRYTPPVGFAGNDSFTYNVSDGLGGTGSASVQVRVGALPVVADNFIVLSDSADNVLDVVANDPQRPDYVSEYVLFTVSGADQGGSLLLDNNKVVYTPAASFVGVERFSYVIRDDSNASWTGDVQVLVLDKDSDRDTAQITLLVEGRDEVYTNAYPQAVADVFTVKEDDTAVLLPLGNDTDADSNDRIVIVDISTTSGPGAGSTTATSSALGATLVLSPTGTPLKGTSVAYDPRTTLNLQQLPVGVESEDTFYYEIIDYGSAAIESFSAGVGATTIVHSANHRLTNGAIVTISGASNAAYNGTFAVGVSVVSDDVFTIPVLFAGDATPRGRWEDQTPRFPTSRSEGLFTVRVIGVNDPPVATLDIITNMTERDTKRLMVRPELANQNFNFSGDPAPAPATLLNQNVLDNDTDIDTDDDWSDLRVVGVMGAVNAIQDYSGTPGTNPVVVTSANHGLVSGTEILIANYGGHVSYNGYHVATVVDANTFTIPRFYVDNHASKGVWVILNDANRYSASTEVGAAVSLVLRPDRLEDHFIVDATASAYLQGLGAGESHTSRFYYAVSDRNSGIGIGPVDVVIEGMNNAPDVNDDPPSLDGLSPLVTSSNSLVDILDEGIDPMYVLPSAGSNRLDVYVSDLSGVITNTIRLDAIWSTDEDSALTISAADLLANDSDVDTNDVLNVISVDPFSRDGASNRLSGASIVYDPRVSANLQALARDELRVDVFSVVVSDGQPGGLSTSVVAVLVVGVNDKPQAFADLKVTDEDSVLVFDARTNDVEIDINMMDPDDQLVMIASTNVANPAGAAVSISSTNVTHDATLSDVLNELAGGMTYTNTFDYTVADNSLLVAVNDYYDVPVGAGPFTLNVLVNDRDYGFGEMFAIAGAGPTFAGGSVTVAPGGTNLLYTPPAGFVGTDHFRYVISNSIGKAFARVVIRSVEPELNGILLAANDAYAVAAGEELVMDVLANDGNTSDSQAGLLITRLISAPLPVVITNNTLFLSATVVPGNYVIRYEVSAGGDAMAEADVTVTVVERRGTLPVRDDAYAVAAGSLNNELNVLANDEFVGGSHALYRIGQIVDTALYGTLAINSSSNALVYTPAAGFIGTEQVRYLATDGLGGTGTGTVTIAVGAVDAMDDFYTMRAIPGETNILDVLANDRVLNLPRGSLAVVSVSPSTPTAIGTLAVGTGGSNLVFSSTVAQGEQDFFYAVTDAGAAGRVVTARVTIATVADGIYANPDRFRVRRGGSNYQLNVLANDISYPSTGRTYSITALGTGANAPDSGGAVSIVSNVLVYTPAVSFIGEESFTYFMSDGTTTDVARVTVSVRPGDLIANPDSFRVYYQVPVGDSQPVSFALPVLANDTVVPTLGQSAQLIALGTGSNAPNQGGTISISTNGTAINYRPALAGPAGNYTESFTYEISDGADRRATTMVTVQVERRTNSLASFLSDDAFSVERNSVSNRFNVLVNDNEAAFNTATVVSVTSPVNGGVVIIDPASGGRSLLYTAPADYVGVDQFMYHVVDDAGGTGEATVFVRIGSLPTVPDEIAVMSTSTGVVIDVVANDLLDSSMASEYVLGAVSTPDQGGAASVVSNINAIFYAPDSAYAGSYPYRETFHYILPDDSGVLWTGEVAITVYEENSDRDSAQITVVVEGRDEVYPNELPQAVDDVFTLTEDDSAILLPLANDVDDDANDRIVIVDVTPDTTPGAGDTAATNSLLGAPVAVSPVGVPLQGASVSYDPRATLALQQLPVGVEIEDTFYYEIIDYGRAQIEQFVAGTASNTIVISTAHRLTNGAVVVISGAAETNYNGTFAVGVSVLDDNSFTIPVVFAGDVEPRGRWDALLPRFPTSRSEGQFTVRVIGVNDPPVGVLDVITNITERETKRLMVRPELAGTTPSYPTDPSPAPGMLLNQNFLSNDTDIDTDDTWETLRVVGVIGSVHEIRDYSGTPWTNPVTVTSVAHGLTTGAEILIANYEGHVSYNGYHVVTVVDADTFTIPRAYIDNNAAKGVWVPAAAATSFSAATDVGAAVTLTLRSNRQEDHLIYNAYASDYLQGLAEGEQYTNRFFYAVRDSNNAIGIGAIDMIVDGLNNTPFGNPDPDSLNQFASLVTESNSLDQVLASGIDSMYVLPPSSGSNGFVNLQVLDRGGSITGTVVISDIWSTDEDTSIEINTPDLLVNDYDTDRTDILNVIDVFPLSREGAAMSLSGTVITYDPSSASNLQALARGEFIVDSFEVLVSDGFTAGTVTTLVAVLVNGVNDSPSAFDDYLVTHEDEILVFDPRTNDVEIDVNLIDPDDRLRIIAITNLANPGEAYVTLTTTNVIHDATQSFLLQMLADFYHPLPANQSFTNVFQYTVTDNSFLFAVDDYFDVLAVDQPFALAVLVNDRDFTVDGAPFEIVDAGPPLFGGSLTISSNAQYLIYQAPTNYLGENYFRYTIRNSNGGQASTRVTVRSVNPALNGILKAADDAYTLAAGESITMDVVANDHVLGAGANLVITRVVNSTLPGQPVLTNNMFVYTANSLDTLSFVYEASAGGTSLVQAAVTVTVVDRRGDLIIQDDAYNVPAARAGNVLDVLANDGQMNQSIDGLVIGEFIQPPAYGTATIENDTIVYTPDADFVGVEQILYRASDGVGGAATGRVLVTVGQLEAASDYYTVQVSSPPVMLDVLNNDRMLPNVRGTLTIVSVTPASLPVGTLEVATNWTHLVFTPSATTGQGNFDYVVQDASTPPRAAMVRVTIDTVTGGTYANPDRYIVRGGGSGYVLDVLANDVSYPPAAGYTITSINNDGTDYYGGTVIITNSTLLYTPTPGFFGEESFNYVISDGTTSDFTRVTVSVRRGDIMPGADNFAVIYEVLPGETLPTSFTLPVLANDLIVPPLGQSLQINVLGIGTNMPSLGGYVEIASNRADLIYRPVAVPAPSYVETFTYEITDGADRRIEVPVSIKVGLRDYNIDLSTRDDFYTVAYNSGGNVFAVLANDGAKPASAAGWTITSASPTAQGGAASIQGGNILYTAPAGYAGFDSFTYSVADGKGGTGSATVHVRIDSMPVVDDLFTVISSNVVYELDVVSNDLLMNSHAAQYVIRSVTNISGAGTVTVGANNRAWYTPDQSYAGDYPYMESFDYTVEDDSGVASTAHVQVVVHEADSDRSTATITLLVEGRNDIPVITNDVSPFAITDKQTIKPFMDVSFTEIDEQLNERVDVTISIDDPVKGALSELGAFEDAGGGVYRLTNITAAAVSLAIRDLLYTPVENRITVPTTENAYFTIAITDNKSPVVLNTNTIVQVTAVNDPVLMVGTRSNQQFYYKLSIDPFNTVQVTEIDDLTLQPLTVTISLLPATNGFLSNLGSFVLLSNGQYRATGITAADVTAELQALSFSMFTNIVIPPGTSRVTRMRLMIDDGFAPPIDDLTTSVIAFNAYEAQVRPTTADLQENFGFAVDTTYDYAIVGAPLGNARGPDSGVAFVYRWDPSTTNTWSQWRQLLPSTVETNDEFGISVSMNRERAAVGAIRDEGIGGLAYGTVYIFDRNEGGDANWGQSHRIVPTNIPASSLFGQSISLDGDLLAVGAPDADIAGQGLKPGAVFLFQRDAGTNTWSEVMRWYPTNAAASSARLGWKISLSGDHLVVGAHQYNANTGAVFHFYRHEGGSNSWGLAEIITTPGTNTPNFFGLSVAVEDDLLAIGAPEMNVRGTASAGRVFVYELDSVSNRYVYAGDLERQADVVLRFGSSLDFDRGRLFVGARGNLSSTYPGAAYLFDISGTNWTVVERVNRPVGSQAGSYGISVGYNDGVAIVGAPVTISPVNNLGYAYMYRFVHNQSPASLATIPDQFAKVGELFSYTLPAGLFFDADPGSTTDIGVSFPDGSNGLSFTSGVINGVPVSGGIFRVVVTGIDDQGTSSVIEFMIRVLDESVLVDNPYNQWLLESFGAVVYDAGLESTEWGPDADPDGDGRSNREEYAFGTDPNEPDGDGIMLQMASNGDFIISYYRRSNDAALDFRLQGTQNFVVWLDVSPFAVSEVVESVTDDVEYYSLRFRPPVGLPILAYRILVAP